MRTNIVGIGQRVAGDDAVGLAVIEELRRRPLPHGTALFQLDDPADLIPMLEEGARVLLVDAVLASPPGIVVELGPAELSTKALQPVSSHGVSVAQAIELARTLCPDSRAEVRIVAVTIARPDRFGTVLSPAVAAVIPKAADRVLELVGG